MKQLQSRIVVQCLITHVLLNHIDNDCDYHYYRNYIYRSIGPVSIIECIFMSYIII